MIIPTWSADFITGYEDIDEQHKTMFGMISDFAKNNNEKSSSHVSLAFLDDLADYCGNHTMFEERLMEEHRYPLAVYHEDLHKKLRNDIRIIRAQIANKQSNPYMSIIEFSVEWLNVHVADDDLTFFSYCRNMNYDLGEYFVGRKCEVLTKNNEYLGDGMIENVEKNTVIITNAKDVRIPAQLNDIVKITSLCGQRGTQTFIATVYYSTTEALKLFNATIIQTENKRTHFRVLTDLDATLRLENKKQHARITDLSAGGLRIETEIALKTNQSLPIEFTIQNSRLMVLCKVVRVLRGAGSMNEYGLKYEFLSNADTDKIFSYVLNRQILARRQKA